MKIPMGKCLARAIWTLLLFCRALCLLLLQFLLLLLSCPLSLQQSSNNLSKLQDVLDRDDFPLDCDDVGERGDDTGVHLIYPAGRGTPVPVYCDMATDGGKWTVFQKRFNGSVSFVRNWNEYKLGFGRADGEYWLGLHTLYLLTLKQKYELRIDLADFENGTASATYSEFSISPHAINPEEDGYSLHVDGFTDGGAGDALSYHNGMKFSTMDRDQDLYPQNCAALTLGAFWFKNCHLANLNGLYLRGAQQTYATGINWYQWKGLSYSLKETEMKIRRV